MIELEPWALPDTPEVGSLVRVKCMDERHGKTGRVCVIDNARWYGVDFYPEKVSIHDCNRHCNYGYGYWYHVEDLEVVG